MHGGILGDDMGIGKTIQTLSTIMLDADKSATLVVCPIAAFHSWETDAKKFFPKLPVYVWHGKTRNENALDSFLQQAGPVLVLINYEAFQDRAMHASAVMKEVQWRRVVLDEAHKMSNRAFGFDNIRQLQALYRWCLSGTPMQNKVEDFEPLFEFLRIKGIDPYDGDAMKSVCLRRTKLNPAIQARFPSCYSCTVDWNMTVQEQAGYTEECTPGSGFKECTKGPRFTTAGRKLDFSGT